MKLAYGPRIVRSGLVLHLDAANRKSYPGSGTVWSDLSGNGNNGTLTNGPTFNGGNGGSIVFDGNNDYGVLSSAQFQSGNNSFSFDCWFLWLGDGTNNIDVIFAYGKDSGPHQVPLLAINTNSNLEFGFGSNSGTVLSSSVIQQNRWYNGVSVYDKNTTKIYLNGILENSTNYSSANIILSSSNGTNAGIGCLFSLFGNVISSPSRYGTFNGNIASIKYYNRALSAQEVRQNFEAHRDRYGI